jgi:hypothetical protein
MKRRSFLGAVIGSLLGGAPASTGGNSAKAEPTVEPRGAMEFIDPPRALSDREVTGTCRWDEEGQRWELLTMTWTYPLQES